MCVCCSAGLLSIQSRSVTVAFSKTTCCFPPLGRSPGYSRSGEKISYKNAFIIYVPDDEHREIFLQISPKKMKTTAAVTNKVPLLSIDSRARAKQLMTDDISIDCYRRRQLSSMPSPPPTITCFHFHHQIHQQIRSHNTRCLLRCLHKIGGTLHSNTFLFCFSLRTNGTHKKTTNIHCIDPLATYAIIRKIDEAK